MRVIGIDPGLRNLGWGVIDTDGARICPCRQRRLRIGSGAALADRLLALLDAADRGVRAAYAPDAAAVEQTFVNRDGAGTLKLGQARGIAMLVPAQAGLDGRRIRAQRGQEDGGRRRPCRQARRSTTWCGCNCPASRSPGRTPPMRWPSRICHAHHCPAPGRLAAALARARRMIGRIAGRLDYAGADHVLIDVRRRRLCRACLGPHAGRAARPGRGGGALYRSAGARGPAAALRLHLAGGKGMAPAADERAGDRREGLDGDPRRARRRRASAGRSRWATGPRSRRRRGSGPKIAQRVVNELKDKAPAVMAMAGAPLAAALSAADAVLDRGRPAAARASAAPRPPPRPRRCRRSPISATRPGEAAARRGRPRAATTPEADTPALIRAALKLLAPKG